MMANLLLGKSGFRYPGIGLVLLAMAATACPAGCQKSRPAQSSPPPQSVAVARAPYSNSFSASGWSYNLRPLGPNVPTPPDKAKELWHGLLEGMAKDEKTRELLSQLHADLPVEFLVLDAPQEELKTALAAPPPEGAAFAMRVADISLKEEKTNTVDILVRVIAYGHATLIKDATASGNLDKLADDWKQAPLPGEPLSLAMEDYIVRHAPGWAVRSGPVLATADENLPGSVEEQRRELDQRLKSYEEHARAYYGALRQP